MTTTTKPTPIRSVTVPGISIARPPAATMIRSSMFMFLIR